MADAIASRALENIELVLVSPQGPRNVGAVARAIVNFGLGGLRMVDGPPPDHPEVVMMAVKGRSVLERALCVGSVDEAVRDCTLLVGTTARRRGRQPTVTPREAAPRILEEARRGKVGILFGREDRGLRGADLRRCHEVIAIEVSPACRALNLAQAALIIAYELFTAAGAEKEEVSSDPGRLVTQEMLRLLKHDLTRALEILGITHEGTRIPHDQSLDRLLALGPIQTRDARVLFALARRIQALEEHLLPLRGKSVPPPGDADR